MRALGARAKFCRAPKDIKLKTESFLYFTILYFLRPIKKEKKKKRKKKRKRKEKKEKKRKKKKR